jgi:triosephosphate isomerase
MSRIPLIAGNWKMNGRRAMAADWVAAVAPAVPDGVEALVCPPFPYIEVLRQGLYGDGLALGGQNLAAESDGAYTGGVSGEMLVDLECAYVIVGHSERRLSGEDDQEAARKCGRAREAGLTPILCVGESLAQREAGETFSVVSRQVGAVLEGESEVLREGLVIAYEPVWAIGTGHTATPEQAQEVHAALRELVAGYDAGLAEKLRLLYGGSVKADNAASLMAQPDIDGGLIGGASLDADSFLAICRAAVS